MSGLSKFYVVLKLCHPVPPPRVVLRQSTQSPFVTLLSQRAQSGRKTSYPETGVVHRII